MVTRRLDPNDRRYVAVSLTEQGKQLYEYTVAIHNESVANSFAVLTLEEQQVLESLLERLRLGLRTQSGQVDQYQETKDGAE